MSAFTDELIEIARRLRDECEALSFDAPVAYVYNPLVYAWAPYEAYLRRYARPEPAALLIGMNPGPFGMLQTGVPFGEIGAARDWLGLEGEVGQPPRLHPKRPIEGYAISRSEVSGRRVWGWARARFETPERFFGRFFIANYCPLGFFDEAGANLTPDKFRGDSRARLYEVCDRALVETVALMKPRAVIGIGRFAEQRAQAALGDTVPVLSVTHPSPANPRAHSGWDSLMDEAVAELPGA